MCLNCLPTALSMSHIMAAYFVSASMENHNLYHPIQECSVSGGEKVSAGSTNGYTNVGSKGRHARRAISYRMNN